MAGPNGEVAARFTWKWPHGTTEVKAYPSLIAGAKPGLASVGANPGGLDVVLPNGSFSQTHPSGVTPGTPFPLQYPLPPIFSSFAYSFNGTGTPTGMGHLTFDIWLQNTSAQCDGWDACGEITNEIMIPITFWGDYGRSDVQADGTSGPHQGRNIGWYDSDVTIDGRLYHLYIGKDGNGNFIPFGNGWKFIVFEPDQPMSEGEARTLNLTSFMNYLTTRKTPNGTKWANGNEWLVSAELGIEPVAGVGDLTIYDYRVWK